MSQIESVLLLLLLDHTTAETDFMRRFLLLLPTFEI